jgi:hypothetical protein
MSVTGGEFWTQVFVKETTGAPYEFVRVWHYEAGSETLRNVCIDEGMLIPAIQPVTGDIRGRVSFYGDGSYRLVVQASVADGGAILYDWQNVRITAKSATLRGENQGLAYPSALLANRGWLFAKTDGSGNILEIGIQKDNAFAALQLQSAPTTGTVSWSKGADLASASTLTLGSDGNTFDITGTNTIFAITSKPAGTYMILRTIDSLTIQHNGASLILAGNANAVTNAGDVFLFVSLGGGNWMEVARRQETVGIPSQSGLTVFTAGPTAQMQAVGVTLRNIAGQAVSRYNTGSINCDVSLAGPVANGRDQASAFSSSSFVHFYWLWNGVTLATIASAVPPTGGPVLPPGFTHWAYATSVFFTGGSLRQTRTRGSRVLHDQQQQVLTAGTQSTETNISLAAVVPSIALSIMGNTHLAVGSGGGGSGTTYLDLRLVSGSTADLTRAAAPSASTSGVATKSFHLANVNQNLIYLLTGETGNVVTRSADLWISGYVLPNGGE